MANNNKRYVNDLKRLLGIKPNQSSLAPADDRPSISGKRGVGYYSSDGQGATGNTGSPNTPQQQPAGDGSLSPKDAGATDNEADAAAGLDQGNIDPTKPTNGAYNGGTKSASDILDDSTAPSPSEDQGSGIGNNGNNPHDIAVKGINGIFDPTSGRPFEIRTDGLPRPDTPPTTDPVSSGAPSSYNTYRAGMVWEAAGGYDHTGSSKNWYGYSAEQAILNCVESVDIYGGGSGANLDKLLTRIQDYTGLFYRYTFTWENLAGPSSPDISYSALFRTCPIVGDDGGFCSIDPTDPGNWPENGVMQLVRNSKGQMEIPTAENTSDVIGTYAGPTSNYNFKFGSGRYGKYLSTANGGFMMIETDSSFNYIDKPGRLFNSQGFLVGFVEPANVPLYLPKTTITQE